MTLKNQPKLPTQLSYKIMALLCGYSLWLTLAQHQLVSQTVSVPLAFYNIPKNYTVTGPEVTRVQISGPRTALYNLNPSDLVAHIDLSGQTPEIPDANANSKNLTQTIMLTNQQLLLPEQIRLVAYETDILNVQFKPEPKGPAHVAPS